MPRKKPAPALSPSQRRDELRLLLRGGWQSLAAIMERLQISRVTAWRRLREIEATEPLESYEDGGFRFWRLPASSREHPLHITTAEMIALAFVRSSLSFLAGTGIKEDLDALIDRFSHVLKAHDYAHWKNIDRKLFDVNEGAYRYDKIDVVNDLVTALLHECRVTCALRDGTEVKVDPYSLVLYKKGLYLVGHSHKRGEIRKWALDKIDDVTRHPGEPFAYPPEFDPARYMRGPFGIIGGPREHVVIHFDMPVAYFVTRRAWHETQAFRPLEGGGTEMTLGPEGWEEMVSWVLGFGAQAEVIEPKALRERVLKEARGIVARYERA